MHTHRVGKLEFDRAKLEQELEAMAGFEFSEAYSHYLCGGPWKSCMLWSVGGEVGSGLVTSYDYQKPCARTRYADRLPYLWSLVESSFDMDKLNFARLAIISQSVIIPHRDLLELTSVPDYARNVHRVHIPLITNDDCYFSEGNVVYRMRLGDVWFFDSSRTHSAASFSEQRRVHLILDFPEVEDAAQLVRLPRRENGGIPHDSVEAREPLSEQERAAIRLLASVIDLENYRDVFSIVIKKHYRKNGGENFVWDMMEEIAAASPIPAVAARIGDMRRYFLERRPA